MLRWQMVQGLLWEPYPGAVGLGWLGWKRDVTHGDLSKEQTAQIFLYIAVALYSKAELLRNALPGLHRALFGRNTQYAIDGQFMVHAMLHVDELADRLMLLRQVRSLTLKTKDGLF